MLFKSAAIAAAVLSFISTSSAQAGVATVYRYVGGTATIYADYCPCPTQGLGGAGTGSGSGSSGTGSGSSGVVAPGSGTGSSGTGSSGTGSSGTGGSGGVVVVPGGSGAGAVPGANGGGVIVGPGSQPGFQVYVSISVGISVGVTTSTFVNNGATFTSVVTTTATVTTPVTMTSAINGGAGVGPIGTSTTPGGGTSTTIGTSSSTPMFSNSTTSSTSSSRPLSVSLTTSSSSSSVSGTTSTGPIGTSTTPGAGTSTTSTSSTATPTSTSSSSSSSASSTTSTTSSAAPAGTLANVVAFIQYDNGQIYGSTIQSTQPVNGQPSSSIPYFLSALQDVNNPVPATTYTDPTVEFYVTVGTGTNFFNVTGSFQGYSQTLINQGTNQVIQPFGNAPAAGNGASYTFNVQPAAANDPLNTSGYPFEITIPGTIFYLTGSTTIGILPGTTFDAANPPADNSGQTSQLKLYFAPVAGGSQTAGRPAV